MTLALNMDHLRRFLLGDHPVADDVTPPATPDPAPAPAPAPTLGDKLAAFKATQAASTATAAAVTKAMSDDQAAKASYAAARTEFTASVVASGVVVDGPQPDGAFDVYVPGGADFQVMRGLPLSAPAPAPAPAS